MLKRLLFLLLFYCAGFVVCAQTYNPIDTADKPQRDLFISQYNVANEMYTKSLREKYSGKTGKELLQSYKRFQEDFVKIIAEGHFCFELKFINKINEVISEIRKSNPSIIGDLRVLIAKDNSPNAYCIGDGTFVINMGLFNFLTNENQLAGVIGHELGHHLLEHSLKVQLRNINENLSGKTAIKELRSERYNRQEKALTLFRNKMYERGDYKKKNELQADSIGYELIKKSKYDKVSYITALGLLAKYDTLKPEELHIDMYKKYFSLPDKPFKEDWLKMEDFSTYNYDFYKTKLEKDSVAAHPETAGRIKILKLLFPELNKDSVEITPSTSFLELKRIAQYEIVPNLYSNEDYGLGVYTCLLRLQNNMDTLYYTGWLGKCLTKIYEARKKYTLNRYLDKIVPKEQSKSYQQFLSFMWNLNLEDIKTFTDYYNNKKS